MNIPEGWKLVPIEPTQEMIEGMWRGDSYMEGWKDALEAAPTPPAQEDEPVAWMDVHDNWDLYKKQIDVIPLYTRPDNSGLRKAAEELLEAWDDPQQAYLNPSIRNLRAALNKGEA